LGSKIKSRNSEFLKKKKLHSSTNSISRERKNVENTHFGKASKYGIYVSNMSPQTNEESLLKCFSIFGEVKRITLFKDYQRKPRAFILFKTLSDHDKALSKSGKVFLNGKFLLISGSLQETLNLNFQNPLVKTPSKILKKVEEGINTIFVGNLSFKSGEFEIKKFFSSCGKVLDIRIGRTKEGSPKGFCHVEFGNSDSVKKAILSHGRIFLGRELRIDTAKPSQNFNKEKYLNYLKNTKKTKNPSSFKSPEKTQDSFINSPLKTAKTPNVMSFQNRRCKTSPRNNKRQIGSVSVNRNNKPKLDGSKTPGKGNK